MKTNDKPAAARNSVAALYGNNRSAKSRRRGWTAAERRSQSLYAISTYMVFEEQHAKLLNIGNPFAGARSSLSLTRLRATVPTLLPVIPTALIRPCWPIRGYGLTTNKS